jgi:RNA 2',3'-cyclic 3'-phosphodiesterase
MFQAPHSPHALTPSGMGLDDDTPFRPETLPDGLTAEYYLLFFAILPPIEVARRAARTAQELRAQHRLSKTAMPIERLHVTVQPVCTFPDVLEGHKLRRVLQIATDVAAACQPLPFRFTWVGSMGRHAPSALALKGDAATKRALAELTAPLAQALQRDGFIEFERGGNVPHMTLVYGTQLIAQQLITPIEWLADRLVLLVSHRGCGHYERLGAWPLRGAVAPGLF